MFVYCAECGKPFCNFSNLRRHIRNFHPSSVTKRDDEEFKFRCDLCNRRFNVRKSFRYHVRHTHGISPDDTNITASCPLCAYSCFSRSYILEHFKIFHGTVVNNKTVQFSSLVEFYLWKKQTEKLTHNVFLKRVATDDKTYYYCQRSGFFRSKGKGYRNYRGSCKINGYCPARIVLSAKDGVYTANFTETHVGHTGDLGHMHLKPKKQSSASKLVTKTAFKEILKERNSVSGELDIERKSLLTQKDLHKIDRTFNSASIQDSNIAVSVDAFAKEIQVSNKDSVLFYKKQNTFSQEHPELNYEDFVFILMNDTQKRVLEIYGSDCICLDRTHGLNKYGFEINTLLVLNDLREGFPCSFMISSRFDTEILKLFVYHIKSRVGIIQPKILMTDLTEIYYTAWMSQMEALQSHLYCAWHVLHDWKKNLSEIKNLEKRMKVNELLKTLLYETDLKAFKIMYTEAVRLLNTDEDIRDFGIYFSQYYGKNTKTWAYCYRAHAGLNTNMHIERMHETIKYVYSKGKQMMSVDKIVSLLMQFIKDKCFDRMISYHKRAISSKIKSIQSQHETSLSMSTENVMPHPDDQCKWDVCNSTGGDTGTYTVELEMDYCPCKLVCTHCKICLHQYSCTCMDSCIQWNMCKHIHLLCRHLSTASTQEIENDGNEPTDSSGDCENYEREKECGEVVKEISTFDQNGSLVTQRKELLKNQFNEVIDMISSLKEADAISQLLSAMKPVLMAVRNTSDTTPSTSAAAISSAPNKKITPRKRTLCSTENIPRKVHLYFQDVEDMTVPLVRNSRF